MRPSHGRAIQPRLAVGEGCEVVELGVADAVHEARYTPSSRLVIINVSNDGQDIISQSGEENGKVKKRGSYTFSPSERSPAEGKYREAQVWER